jgi:L-lactate dehydrogenase
MLHLSVIGAGSVGVAVVSAIVQGRLARRVSLFDMAASKAEGEALDFAHAAPLLDNVVVEGGGLEGAIGGDVCVITAGVKQREGESRVALLARNARAISSIAEALEARPLPRIAIVVTNPVDAMTTWLRARWASRGVTVVGSGTLLDTLRLRAHIARRLTVSAESVHAYVIGEHGDSSVSLLDSASAAGVTLAELANRRGVSWDEDVEWELAQRYVRQAANAVIARKGATCHAIGVSVARIVRAIAHHESAVLPLSVPYDDVTISTPACIHGGGIDPLGVPTMSEREREAFAASLAAVRRMCADLK